MSPSHGHTIARDQSFERLYRRHRRDVYGAVLRDVRDPDEAEDVTQIAFLNAFRAIRRGEEPEKPRAWLVTIARNVVRRRYKAQALRPQEVGLDPELTADLMNLEGPTAGEIASAIRRLPPNQRAVILLREIQGRTYAEIAEELELSLSAVETLIFRARRSLSERLRLIDQVPATQERRARRLRGLLALPLPGLGKISFGFSVGRAAVAAFVGGAALVALPVADLAPDPARPPAAGHVPPSVSKPSRAVSAVPTPKTTTEWKRHTRDRNDAHKRGSAPAKSSVGAVVGGVVGGAVSGVQDLAPSVDPQGVVPPVEGPIPGPTVPNLPVEPPALPPVDPPAPPPVDPPTLPPLPSLPPLPPPPGLGLGG